MAPQYEDSFEYQDAEGRELNYSNEQTPTRKSRFNKRRQKGASRQNRKLLGISGRGRKRSVLAHTMMTSQHRRGDTPER